MKYPCEMIKDLIPLYIDKVCSNESGRAVEEHIEECKQCEKYYNAMKETSDFVPNKNNGGENNKMAESLKRVKIKINRKIRKAILCAVSAVIVLVAGFNLLFNLPIKTVSKNEVSVSAKVYSLSELAENSKKTSDDTESVFVYTDEDEKAEAQKVLIPGLGNVVIAKDTIEKCKYATVVSVSSKYFLRTIRQETKGNTIYIRAFKTTFFNNKAKDYQKTISSLEFKEINEIVFVDSDGQETTLWKS